MMMNTWNHGVGVEGGREDELREKKPRWLGYREWADITRLGRLMNLDNVRDRWWGEWRWNYGGLVGLGMEHIIGL